MSDEKKERSIEEIGDDLVKAIELQVERVVNQYVGQEVTDELVEAMTLKLVSELEDMAKEIKPSIKPPKIKCIGCGQLIKHLYVPSEEPHRDCWSAAIVSKIFAGFGACYETNEYLIGICDMCVEHNVQLGRLILVKEGT